MSRDEFRREMDNLSGVNSVVRGAAALAKVLDDPRTYGSPSDLRSVTLAGLQKQLLEAGRVMDFARMIAIREQMAEVQAHCDSVKLFTPSGPRELVADPRVPRDMMLPPKQTAAGKIAMIEEMIACGRIMITPTDIAELLAAPSARTDLADAIEYAAFAGCSIPDMRRLRFVEAVRAGAARLTNDFNLDGPWAVGALIGDIPEALRGGTIELESGPVFIHSEASPDRSGKIAVIRRGWRTGDPIADVDIATLAVEVSR